MSSSSRSRLWLILVKQRLATSPKWGFSSFVVARFADSVSTTLEALTRLTRMPRTSAYIRLFVFAVNSILWSMPCVSVVVVPLTTCILLLSNLRGSLWVPTHSVQPLTGDRRRLDRCSVALGRIPASAIVAEGIQTQVHDSPDVADCPTGVPRTNGNDTDAKKTALTVTIAWTTLRRCPDCVEVLLCCG